MFDTVVTVNEAEVTAEAEIANKNKIIIRTETSQINELDSIPQAAAALNCNLQSSTTTTTTTKTTTTKLLVGKCSHSVQNLRNLWNQRILQQQQQQNGKNSNNSGHINFLNKRAQSLHDCTEIDVKSVVMARDRLQREKDNFYKYKTAEQSSRYKRYDHGRPTSYLLMRRSTLTEFNLTTTETTTNETEMMMNNNNDSKLILNTHEIDNNKIDKPPKPPPRALKQITTTTTNNNNIFNAEPILIDKEEEDKKEITKENFHQQKAKKEEEEKEKEEEEEKNVNINIKKPTTTIEDKNIVEKCEKNEQIKNDIEITKTTTTKTTTAAIESNNEEEEEKKDKMEFELKTTTTNNQKVEKTTTTTTMEKEEASEEEEEKDVDGEEKIKNVMNPKRRYSFKSYTKTYPIGGSKIMNNRESIGLTNLCSSNIVANLTQQFNNIIKNDKNLLNEVKYKKNGILMTRGAHIYKVIDQNDINHHATTTTNNQNSGVNIKRNNSTILLLNSTPVSKQIKRFESTTATTATTTTNIKPVIKEKPPVVKTEPEIDSFAEEVEEERNKNSSIAEQLSLPNASFVHANKQLNETQALAEAVNVTLVNTLNLQNSTPTTTESESQCIKESIYEPIAPLLQENYELDNDYESIEDATESYKAESCVGEQVLAAVPPTYTPICRNTNDELPELPKPKRRLPKSPMPGKRCNTPKLPPKQQQLTHHNKHNQSEKENIYCTIKRTSHCYESLKAAKAQSLADSISLASNGYEHINNYRSTCGSTLTLSSEHKTNSLYDATSAAGSVFGTHYGGSHVLKSNAGEQLSGSVVCERSLSSCESIKDSALLASESYTHLNVPASDNSDDWIDMTDTDEASTYAKINTPQFVVVRERFKGMRTHQDWSKLVRDKRLQNKGNSFLDDDSDHYYETLLPMTANKAPASEEQKVETAASDLALSCEYDSFDTDTEDTSEVTKQKQQDMDMYHMRLPDPPAGSTNQVYAIVRKFKNFISNKKGRHATSSSSVANKSFSSQKLYENTSHFYVNENNYENVTKPSSEPKKNVSDNGAEYKNMHSSTLRSKSNSKRMSSAQRANHTQSTQSTFYVDDYKNGTEANTSKQSNGVTTKRQSSKEQTLSRARPHEPPPPPPPESRPVSGTLWYAEWGLFENDNAQNEQARNKSTASYNGMHSSWYAEAGLYQVSGTSSLASSSGSSAVSTVNESQLGDENLHSMFLNEPLYQIYNAAKLESISRDLDTRDNGSSVDYEEIARVESPSVPATAIEEPAVVVKEKKRPSALQLVEPKNGPSRTLWSEIPEVIQSNILSTLTARERSLQEAKFEIITSEASYLKSLNLLRNHFMSHPLFSDTNVVSARDRRVLFGHITPVHECSERLLTELEQCWQDNIMLLGLSKRIYDAAEEHFHVYVNFCEHQGRMDRTLRSLKESSNSAFSQNLELLEQSAVCFGLNLHSFLMLPMQRITRLPLLIDAVFSKMQYTDEEYDSWKRTLAMMNKLVAQCNEAANASEQAYEIERISRQLEFPSTVRALAIAPAGVAKPGAKPRYLVKRGELTHLIWRGEDAKLTFGKKFSKVSIYVFLFSDLLVLTKRKNEDLFTVIDYCPRNMLTISKELPQIPIKELGHKNLIFMTLLENHDRKTVEMLLSCPSVSEQERWLSTMQPKVATSPGESLYEQWDCPQVVAKHTYASIEPDALNLDVGDVVNVSRKLPDGWYHGERIRDGATGWFPGSYTYEVNSAHVRARNLKQRNRLLTLTANYLEAQKSK